MSTSTHQEATIEAVPDLPVVRITRDFRASREQLIRAHTDQHVFVRWIGPTGSRCIVDRWDGRTGGHYRYCAVQEGREDWFYGSFHHVGDDRLVQTFTWEGMPEGVSLDTMTFEDLGQGCTRLIATSVVATIEARDGMLASGMEAGINDGYAKLDELLGVGEVDEAASTEAYTNPAERHRMIAGRFSDAVAGVAPGDWDRSTPVEGWVARDVVRHLVRWLPVLLESSSDVRLPVITSVDDDPAAAWHEHTLAVQALVDEPGDRVVTNPHFGEVPLAEAIDRFYTSDVFMHTWDLACATGQDDALDEATCAQMLSGMEPLDEVLRSSGQYGPQVPVSPDASVQDRLIAFIGRDPAWRPTND